MISIIVPAYNCAEDLKRLLDGVARSAAAPREVLVVDDGSTDGTADAARGRPGVEVIAAPHGGPAKARNLGAARARGEVLIFVDADVALPERGDVLRDLAAVLESRPEVDCAGSPSDVQPLESGAIAYNNSVYHRYYMDALFGGRPAVTGNILFFTSRLCAIRASSFRRAGGFHEGLWTVMNEDGEFAARCHALGLVSSFHESLSHGHRWPTGFSRFAKSYFMTAMVQRWIDARFDTSSDPSVSRAEAARRLLAFGLLAGAPLALRGGAWAAGYAAAWAVFVASLGRLNALVWRHVPAAQRLPWYLVYVAITPVILGGYAAGLLVDAVGACPLDGPRGSLA